MLKNIKKLELSKTTTFSNNLSIPIHRWFRYSAGFSAEWVSNVINKEIKHGKKNVLDPFAGSGTVQIEAEKLGVRSIGVESHPLVSRIAQTKMYWRNNPEVFHTAGTRILEKAKKNKNRNMEYPELIHRCFSKNTLLDLNSLKNELVSNNDNSEVSELLWLTLISILRECSDAGTAPWQYILPNKKKKNAQEPFTAFSRKLDLMKNDMILRQNSKFGPQARILNEDIRERTTIRSNWGDLLITSPPYANNFDYADATRFELSFIGEIDKWGELQSKIRKYLMRSCTQHISPYKKEVYQKIDDPLLNPIHDEILEACKQLDNEKENHGGKKHYHAMIGYYFFDMAKIWHELRRIMKENSKICFVIGDSAPYGVHIPVEQWIGKLSLDAGFKSFTFKKIRDRNVKWKNRKHRVPLHEGHLWISG